jgi:hypothetical protein
MLPFVDQIYYTPCLPTLINNYLFNIPVNGILSNKIKLSMLSTDHSHQSEID